METGIYWPSFFFSAVRGIACAFAIAVLFTRNIVRMAFYLVLSLWATAGLFFLAGAEFVGAMQLMIYVGGTLVLLIFGVMLTAQSPFVSMKTSGRRLGAGCGGWRLAVGCVDPGAGALSVDWQWPRDRAGRTKPWQNEPTATQLGLGLMGIRPDQQTQENETR